MTNIWTDPFVYRYCGIFSLHRNTKRGILDDIRHGREMEGDVARTAEQRSIDVILRLIPIADEFVIMCCFLFIKLMMQYAYYVCLFLLFSLLYIPNSIPVYFVA